MKRLHRLSLIVALTLAASLPAVLPASAQDVAPPVAGTMGGRLSTLAPGLDLDASTLGIAPSSDGALHPAAALVTGTTLNGGQLSVRAGTTGNVMVVHGSGFTVGTGGNTGTRFQFTPAFGQAGSMSITHVAIDSATQATITFDVSADAVQWFALWTAEPGDPSWTEVLLLQVYDGKGLLFPLPTPTRLADNRNGVGGRDTPLEPGGTWHIPIAGQAGIPASATAVSLNLTAIGGPNGGWLALYPAGNARPPVSTVNFGPSWQVVPNHVIVPLGQDGALDLFNGGGDEVWALVDVDGYYSGQDVPGGLMYVDSTPARVIDMRTSGLTIAPGQTAAVTLTYGNSRALPQGYVADINVTITNQTGAGWASVYGGGMPLPQTSTHNWTAPGQDTANRIAVQVGADGSVNVTNGSNGSIQVIVDLFGAYNPAIGYRFTPVTPTRVVDTRAGGPLAQNQSTALDTKSWASTAPRAFVGNLTGSASTSATYLQLWSGSIDAPPPVSNLNLQNWETRANGFIQNASSDAINIHNAFGDAYAIIDVFGTFDR